MQWLGAVRPAIHGLIATLITNGYLLTPERIKRLNRANLESSPPELVALYGLNRQANVRLLRRLKADDLHKSARHPELDHRVTVADYVQMMSKHGPNHLEQVERLKKEAMGK